ncbi:hypothetical protein KCP77_24955 (plasmid) [Salmonella enterica subsp. enterica]|nr:hypothetical protein KCP77_24955 [Salmonella enterica subsp. enterica]
MVDLRDHRIAGAEALMRWRHPRKRPVAARPVPAAGRESFGLMPGK